MSVTARLAELGVEVPEVVPPVASYQPAVRAGDFVYTAGQLPFKDGVCLATGKVDQVKRIVKVVVFVASTPDFTAQPGVANGASEFLGQVFGEAGKHVRSAVGVSVLPLDAPVEVELVVQV